MHGVGHGIRAGRKLARISPVERVASVFAESRGHLIAFTTVEAFFSGRRGGKAFKLLL